MPAGVGDHQGRLGREHDQGLFILLARVAVGQVGVAHADAPVADAPAPESYAEFGNDTARRSRVPNTEEQFESRLLPLFAHRIRKVAELILLKKFGGISLKSERLYYRKCA